MSSSFESLPDSPRGFTLVEMLVAVGILSIILLVLSLVTAQTQKIWTNTNTKIEQFRGARSGFNTLTQRLSQATLNTYIGYSDGNPADTFYNTATFAPTSFTRRSELRFLCGLSSTTLASATPDANSSFSGQSVFFLAPLGYTATRNGSATAQLTQMLTVCGYYLEFGPDPSVPSFYTGNTRYRYRLMELLEPSEDNSVYPYSTGVTTGKPANQWIVDAFGLPLKPTHSIAENIIALIILPELSQDEKQASGTPFPFYSLAPYYGYDSTQLGGAGSPTQANPTGGTTPSYGPNAGALDTSAQLPPVVQVTMVAIDEPSAIRLQNLYNTAAPNFGLSTLFQNAQNYAADLDQLQANLLQRTYTDSTTGTPYNPSVTLPQNINYHIFTTMVSIKGAQWSTIQTD
jgi:uncharacterized protein (TIGR02599 family)